MPYITQEKLKLWREEHSLSRNPIQLQAKTKRVYAHYIGRTNDGDRYQNI